jgi:hypothetical protein
MKPMVNMKAILTDLFVLSQRCYGYDLDLDFDFVVDFVFDYDFDFDLGFGLACEKCERLLWLLFELWRKRIWIGLGSGRKRR